MGAAAIEDGFPGQIQRAAQLGMTRLQVRLTGDVDSSATRHSGGASV